jgi:hypothetical protein
MAGSYDCDSCDLSFDSAKAVKVHKGDFHSPYLTCNSVVVNRNMDTNQFECPSQRCEFAVVKRQDMRNHLTGAHPNIQPVSRQQKRPVPYPSRSKRTLSDPPEDTNRPAPLPASNCDDDVAMKSDQDDEEFEYEELSNTRLPIDPAPIRRDTVMRDVSPPVSQEFTHSGINVCPAHLSKLQHR